MIRKFVQRSILCAFDMTPMEKKTGKTASLKHRISGKQKKNTRRPRAKIVKQKKNVRLPWKKIKNVKRALVFHGRRRIF